MERREPCFFGPAPSRLHPVAIDGIEEFLHRLVGKGDILGKRKSISAFGTKHMHLMARPFDEQRRPAMFAAHRRLNLPGTGKRTPHSVPPKSLCPIRRKEFRQAKRRVGKSAGGQKKQTALPRKTIGGFFLRGLPQQQVDIPFHAIQARCRGKRFPSQARRKVPLKNTINLTILDLEIQCYNRAFLKGCARENG